MNDIEDPGSMVVNLNVNGSLQRVEVDENTPLLSVLRQDLGLKGARVGCGEGYCGACTVLVDERPVQSCNTPVWSVVDRPVVTIEGIGASNAFLALREAFLDIEAAQCAYCINGITMTLSAMLNESEPPSRARLIETLAERHLCRCGAHARILRVVDTVFGFDGVSDTDDE